MQRSSRSLQQIFRTVIVAAIVVLSCNKGKIAPLVCDTSLNIENTETFLDKRNVELTHKDKPNTANPFKPDVDGTKSLKQSWALSYDDLEIIRMWYLESINSVE